MKKFCYLFFKRLFDIISSLLGIAVFLVPMLIVGLLVLFTSGFPIIFRQKRIGKNRRLFTIYKFRTMKKGTPATATRDASPAAVTRLGRFLRITSLDELPQLFNILFGTMSVVGPRPVVCNETDQADERDKYGANKLKPGLTGWAQINGRSGLDIYEKARYDGEYAARASFWFDLRIIFITFFQVIRGKDIAVGKSVPATVGVTAATAETVSAADISAVVEAFSGIARDAENAGLDLQADPPSGYWGNPPQVAEQSGQEQVQPEEETQKEKAPEETDAEKT